MGSCYDIPPPPDAGPPVLPDAGPVVLTDSGTGAGDGSVVTFNDGGRITGPPRRGAGCACRADGGGGSPRWLLGLGVLGLALAWRRRR
jgi:MYXO-CTERM domain-containing protein